LAADVDLELLNKHCRDGAEDMGAMLVFLDAAAKGGAEIFRDFRSGQTFEGRAPEDHLPSFSEEASRGRIGLGVDPVGPGVIEEQVLW